MIWIPADVHPLESCALACLTYAGRCGYHVEGIVHAPWKAVEQMMVDRDVDVVVIADPAHLPADRTPRIEVAADPPASRLPPAPEARPVPPRRRRPHTTR